MDPKQLFPDAVTAECECDLRERLRAQRVGQFRALLAERDRFDALAPFIQAISRLNAGSAERAIAYLDTWPTTYFISRVLHHGLEPAAAATRLTAGLLFESMSDGSSPLADLELTFQTEVDGSIVVPHRAGRLVIDAFQGAPHTMRWECGADRARIYAAGSGRTAVEVPLPIRPGASSRISFTPCPPARPWGIPILDRGRELFFHFTRTPDAGGSTGSKAALSLDESLRAAFDALESTWPECIQWAKALIPAFAELEDEYTPGKRQSGSFGPGIPVYLTRVPDRHLHAEDIVHELQHQRFQLLVPADDWFGLWPCRSTVFVSPYRADLRPMAGIHLGVHAFVTVNEFRLRYIARAGSNEAVLKELVSLHHKNVFALRLIISSEVLKTPAAKAYYATVASAMSRHQAFLDSRMPDRLCQDGTLALERHLDYVRQSSKREVSYSRPTVEELAGYAQMLLQDGGGA